MAVAGAAVICVLYEREAELTAQDRGYVAEDRRDLAGGSRDMPRPRHLLLEGEVRYEGEFCDAARLRSSGTKCCVVERQDSFRHVDRGCHKDCEHAQETR